MKKLTVTLFFFLFAALLANAQMTEKWKSLIPVSSSTQTGVDLAKDSDGNVYVVGKIENTSDWDILLVKYSPSGEEQWQVLFDNGGDDTPIGIAIDASNNIFIGCNSEISGTTNKITCLRYNTSGVLQSQDSWGGLTGSTATAMFLNGSNLHIAGYYNFDGSKINIATVKFNTDGTVAWGTAYDNSNTDKAYDIVVRGTGDVFVTGQTGTDAVILKYTSAGVLSWARTYSTNMGYSIAIGGAGTAFAVYAACNNGSNTTLLKYDNAGTLAWNKSITGSSLLNILFSSGGIYVPINSTKKVVKYIADGTYQWEYALPSYTAFTSSATKVLLVENGALYVGSNTHCPKVNLTSGEEEDYIRDYGINVQSIIAGNNGDILLTGKKSSANNIATMNICVPVSPVEIVTFPLPEFCTNQSQYFEAANSESYLWTYTNHCSHSVTISNENASATWVDAPQACFRVDITVHGQDIYGCPSSQTKSFETIPSPLMGTNEVLYDTPLEFCDGGFVKLYTDRTWNQVEWFKNGEFVGSGEHYYAYDEGNYYAICYNIYDCYDTTETETVSFIPQPVANLGEDIEECADHHITLSSGITDGTYLWSTGETTETIDVTTAGIFSVTVSVSGCANAVDEIEITRIPNPKPNLGEDQTVCQGTGVLLDAGSGFLSYNWSNSFSNQSQTVYDEGNYWVEVENANGCVNWDTVKIELNDVPEFTVSEDKQICLGDNVTIEASEIYSFVYTDEFDFGEDLSSHNYTEFGSVNTHSTHKCGDNNSTFIGADPGTTGAVEITVEVVPNTDAIKLLLTIFHSNSNVIDIEVDGIQFYGIPIINSCTVNEILLSEIGAATADGEVVLRFADNDPSGTYNGRVFLNYLEVYSNNLTGDALWTSIPEGYTSTDLSINVSPSETTKYVFSFDDGTCIGYDTVEVKVISIDLGENITACHGDNIVLDAGEGFESYLWSTGEETQTIEVTTTDTYSVTATHAAGCEADDAIMVTFNPFPSAAGTISGLTTVTQGDNGVEYVVPEITNADSYIWTLPTGATGESTTNSITVNFGASAESGNITVKGVNDCGYGVAAILPVTVSRTVPFFENFDIVTAPALPKEWVEEDINADGYNWKSTTTNFSPPNGVYVTTSALRVMNDWLFTPHILFSEGKTYKLSFYSRALYSSYAEKIKVHLGTSQNVDDMQPDPILDLTSVNNTTFELSEVLFSVTSTGSYILGFHGYQDVSSYSIYVDDISIEEITTYSVAFEVIGGNGILEATVDEADISSGDFVEAGKSIIFTATPNDSYKVKQWKVGEVVQEGETANEFTYHNLQQNISVTVEFEATEYSITYNTDGGSHSNPTTYTVESEFPIALADASKTNYDFLGWFDNESLTGSAITQIAEGTTGNLAFWAKFDATEYTITYNADGGTHSNPTAYTVEDEFPIVLADASKTDYDFLGWYDNASFTGSPITQIEEGTTGNLEFWAKFEATEYSITFNADEGTHSNPTAYTVEDEFPIVLADASKTGYDFLGWFDNESFTGSAITQIAEGTTGNLEFWAKFEATEYTITYNADGGTHINPTAYTVESEFPIVLADAGKTNYDFLGWFDNESFTGSAINQIEAGTTGALEFWALFESASTVPTTEVVTGITLADGDDECFNATETITVAGTGTVIVEPGASVNFIAGQSIRFLPGFHAKAGSAVNAWITTTADFCPPAAGGSPVVLAGPVVEKSLEEPELFERGEFFAEKSMKVYPNPNNGIFTVELKGFDCQTRLIIFNTAGQIVLEQNVAESTLCVEISNIRRGIYFIKAINQQKQFDQKLIIQ